MVGHNTPVFARRSEPAPQPLLIGRGDYCNEFLGLIYLAKGAAKGALEINAFVATFLKRLRDDPSTIPTFRDYLETKPVDTEGGKLQHEITHLCDLSDKIIAQVSALSIHSEDKGYLRKIFDTLRDFVPIGYTDYGILAGAVKAYDANGGFTWQEVLDAIEQFETSMDRFRVATLPSTEPSNGRAGTRVRRRAPRRRNGSRTET
jgi:hypothetical protein